MGNYLYNRYIHSESWKDKKAEFKEHLNRIRRYHCHQCKTKEGPFDVHHTTYARLGHEDMEDLRLTCVRCHKAIHGKKKGPSRGTPYMRSTGGRQTFRSKRTYI